MASKASIVEFIVGQLGAGVSAKKMFGEYGVYHKDLLIGLICDDALFIKPTDTVRALLGRVELGPPYPGAKDSFIVPEDKWDDADFMCEIARMTAAALPAKKPKKPKKPKSPKAKLRSR